MVNKWRVRFSSHVGNWVDCRMLQSDRERITFRWEKVIEHGTERDAGWAMLANRCSWLGLYRLLDHVLEGGAECVTCWSVAVDWWLVFWRVRSRLRVRRQCTEIRRLWTAAEIRPHQQIQSTRETRHIRHRKWRLRCTSGAYLAIANRKLGGPTVEIGQCVVIVHRCYNKPVTNAWKI